MLVHHADSPGNRLPRRLKFHMFAFKTDFPFVRLVMPNKMFMSVVLPAPFSPNSACISPCSTDRSTSSLAYTPAKDLVICFISSNGICSILSFQTGPAPPDTLSCAWFDAGPFQEISYALGLVSHGTSNSPDSIAAILSEIFCFSSSGTAESRLW